MNRILFDASEVSDNGVVSLSDERAWHIRKILRAKEGDSLRIGIVNGPLGTATVQSVGKPDVVLHASLEEDIPTPFPITVLLALPRPRMINRILSSLSSMGVAGMVLTGSDRVEASYFDSHALEEARMREHMIEGLMQSGCLTFLPDVRIETQLAEAVSSVQATEGLQVLYEPGPSEFVPARKPESVVFAIGPEGGWTTPELELFDEAGFKRLSLGAEIYRTDVACIAAMHQMKGLFR